MRAPARATLPPINEEDWQQQVIDLAKLYGWKHFHPYDSRRSVAGFPDLTLVRPPRVIFVELKKADGIVTPEQHEWLRLFSLCGGVESYVWRPADLERARQTLSWRHKP